MSIECLYKKAISYWPKSIDVKERIVYKNGGIKFIELVRVHDIIQEKISTENCLELEQMDWAILTVLHDIAKFQNELFPEKLNYESVIEVYTNNLKKDVYEIESH